MRNEIIKTLSYSTNLLISPDADGILSAEFLNRYNGSKVVGTYDKNILCLADGIDPSECLFVDCDMNREEFVSLGNHMRLIRDGMSSKSFNPNVHFGVTTYRMEHLATKYIIDNSDIAKRNDAQARFDYVDQSFTSKRYGKTRYIDTLNNALQGQEMAFEPLVQGMKCVSDKVGIETLIRYNRDIISYAEIFTGEYSVTYDQEKEWV